MAQTQFKNLETLLAALTKAPQDREGGFRVATWKMVIEEILAIKAQVSDTSEAVKNTPSVEQITQTIKQNIQDTINTEDAGTILF